MTNTIEISRPAARSRNSNLQPLTVIKAGTLSVMRRDEIIVPFDIHKISVAMTKAFLAVEGTTANNSERIRSIVAQLTAEIMQIFKRRFPAGGTLHIEDIQDQVELALMRKGEHKVAREYVLYREERRQIREQSSLSPAAELINPQLTITQADGSRTAFDVTMLTEIINAACIELPDVNADIILKETIRNLYDGIPIAEVMQAIILSARSLIEKEPHYSFVTARILLQSVRQEALKLLDMPSEARSWSAIYTAALPATIQKGIACVLLNPALAEFNLTQLAEALHPSRDLQFSYLGLQTLYDRYFLHQDGVRFELPQIFFMRVAMGLALNEKNREQAAIEFYQLLSSFDYMSSTPTLFNSGTARSQLSSCYLTTIPDDLDNIFGAIRDNALLSKFAGGLGNDWTPVRAINANIKGTNGKSQGVVPFMKVANDTAVAVNQGGKRKGAVCAYLETWHLDIEEFLELRKNTGDDRRRTHDMNTANWIPDLFLKRVEQNTDWTLFSPDEVPDLHDSFGLQFEEKYQAYEQLAQQGKIRNFKVIPALNLWRKMLSLLFETGHPWITFKDPCNIRSPQQHKGVVHSSNLCTEITLNTSLAEIAVCNLGSINLAEHVDENGLLLDKLQTTIRTAVRMLDNVIDINFYAVPQAKHSNMQHRPIGLGLMGFQDALYKMSIPYASAQAVEFADRSMEVISYYAIEASVLLAEERGPYPSFEGSLWSQGILPIDSIALLQTARQGLLEQNTDQTLAWDALRERVKRSGIRNSNIMAIAPTATISNICNVVASIEPTYQNLFVKSNLSGEFTVINPYLVADLKALNLWDEVMIHDLKFFNGNLSAISRIPAALKSLYATAFEIDPTWLVEAGSRRQKWLDQAQSLNLYLAEPSGKRIDQLYRLAWKRGLKTTYYLRTLGATNAEKSTISDTTLNAVKVTPNACAIDNPDCEACQ